MNLQLCNVSFSYNHKKVFSDLSVDFSDGKLIAVGGNNGSGKSTLLKLVAGILEPEYGQIFIDDREYKQLGRRNLAQKISYVPQFIETAFDLQVIDFLTMTAERRQPFSKKELFEKAYTALERVGIEDFVQRNINELSGGERQKVLIANALSQNAPLMLLDEPVSHLDWSSQIEIFKLLREIVTNENCKIIVIAHDINLIAMYCSHVLLMKNGEVVTYGKTSEILEPQVIQNVFDLKVRNVDNYFMPIA